MVFEPHTSIDAHVDGASRDGPFLLGDAHVVRVRAHAALEDGVYIAVPHADLSQDSYFLWVHPLTQEPFAQPQAAQAVTLRIYTTADPSRAHIAAERLELIEQAQQAVFATRSAYDDGVAELRESFAQKAEHDRAQASRSRKAARKGLLNRIWGSSSEPEPEIIPVAVDIPDKGYARLQERHLLELHRKLDPVLHRLNAATESLLYPVQGVYLVRPGTTHFKTGDSAYFGSWEEALKARAFCDRRSQARHPTPASMRAYAPGTTDLAAPQQGYYRTP